MGTAQGSEARARIRAENVGGIDETDVEFRPGVNVLTGWNATNRTSLLQAVMAALGSGRASLKGDADEGRVELTVDGETYTRSMERRDGRVVFGGEPYTDGATLADLFAFLLESNEARRAVARGEDLREIIMRPVDTAEIQAEIETLESRKREIEAELDERGRLADELASAEAERTALAEDIEEKREELAAKRDRLEAVDAGFEETRERKAELESKLETLRERRSDREDVRFRLETERETAEGIRGELEDVEAELAELEAVPTEEVDELDERIEALRERKRVLDSQINQLQGLIQFNEGVIEGEELGRLDVLESGTASDADVTDRLLPESESFVCWTCGEAATRTDVEEMLERLRQRRAELVEERQAATAELEDATERRATLRERQERRASLEQRRHELEASVAEAEETIETLTDRREGLDAEIGRLESAVEELREDEYDEIIDLHKAANALELAVEQLESEREEADRRLEEIQGRLDELDELEAEREEVRAGLADARTRIEDLENEAVAAFNDHMAAILDALDYDNVERIWLERVEREVRDGRPTVTRGFFDLHVIRRADGGTVYEDTVQHLSESEREVTGLVFALAGYLVHEVHEPCPFMLLDSIEALDSGRIATLVEYLAEYADYLVVALLPEDAEAVDDRHRRITEI